MAGIERLTPNHSEDPISTISTHRMKEEHGKTAGDKNGASSKANIYKGIHSALETRQSKTIEYWVTKIVQQRYWQGNKSHAGC